MIDWDAPASDRLSATFEPDGVGRVVLRDRRRPEVPLAELDIGTDGPASQELLALTSSRLETMTLREFCTEYGIDSSRIEVEDDDR